MGPNCQNRRLCDLSLLRGNLRHRRTLFNVWDGGLLTRNSHYERGPHGGKRNGGTEINMTERTLRVCRIAPGHREIPDDPEAVVQCRTLFSSRTSLHRRRTDPQQESIGLVAVAFRSRSIQHRERCGGASHSITKVFTLNRRLASTFLTGEKHA